MTGGWGFLPGTLQRLVFFTLQLPISSGCPHVVMGCRDVGGQTSSPSVSSAGMLEAKPPAPVSPHFYPSFSGPFARSYFDYLMYVFTVKMYIKHLVRERFQRHKTSIH